MLFPSAAWLHDIGYAPDLVGHTGGSKVTELIYRHGLRPVMETGAQAMDAVFGDPVNSKDQEECSEAG